MKRMIWTSRIDIESEEWIGYIEDFYDDDYREITCSEASEAATCINLRLLEDAEDDLDIEVPGELICIADLGLWNGRRMGYKEISGKNISKCLEAHCDGDCEFYVDEHKNLRATEWHHDGTNYYLYRMLKPELSDTQVENFKLKLWHGTATSKDITRYTRRLGDKICEVYGW